MRRTAAAFALIALCFFGVGWAKNDDPVIEYLREIQREYASLPDEYGFSAAMVSESRQVAFLHTTNYTKENILALEELFPEINLYMLAKANPLDQSKYMKDAWGIDEVWFISPDDTQTIEANKTVIDYLDQIGPSKHGGYIWIQMWPEEEEEVLIVLLLDENSTIDDMIKNNPDIRIVVGHADHSIGQLEETRSKILDRAEEFAITDAYIELTRNVVTVHTSRYTVENIHAIREAFPEFDLYQILDEEGLL